MTEVELAWTAGLFEGEGSVRISKPAQRNWGSLVVSTVNTDIQIIEWFQVRWPGCMKVVTGMRPEQKTAWFWVLAAKKAAAFLEQIVPYIVRDAMREKIRIGLDFQAGKSSRARWMTESERYAYAEQQWNAYWWMGHLNERGRPEFDQHRRRK